MIEINSTMINPILILSLTFLILTVGISAIEDDVKCLEGVKNSLNDPQGKLTSWTFTNISVEYICKQLVGVSCWNEKESRIISLQLPSMGLTGQLPDSLQFCSSLQNLDLSGNDLSGPIPSRICNWLPYLTTLDLSSNTFSSSIPPEIANCRFVNNLILGNNRLTGRIPYGLGQLDRIRKFSVVNNKLSGSIPSDISSFPADDFAGNNDLCGKPLSRKCGKLSSKNLAIIIAAGVLGAVGSLLLALLLWRWCLLPSLKKKKDSSKLESSWVKKLKVHKLEQVSLFQKPLVKIRLNDLMAATSNFDSKNIIMTTKTGVTFKAVLHDGSALAIKRLSSCKHSEKMFGQEMNNLGQLRHPNLVPLLGFCIVEDERLLVYKHMPNASLFEALHGTRTATTNAGPLDWQSRLRIAIGTSRGLAWLHHGCKPPYIHQYISSSVILIDDDFESRITDFGLARLVGSDYSNRQNMDLGEFGYVAPEYASTMVSTKKGDVYAFGVVLVELVTCQKSLEVVNGGGEDGFKGSLVDWINQLIVSERIKEGIDKSIVGRGNDDEILQVIKIGRRCLVNEPKDRPSMVSVYQSLKTIGIKHGFSQQFDDEFPIGEEDDQE
ncbi:probable inactive receptor kinase At1g27190 [Impatiens glandulifera]|uniref:probable inactive receptor kinase At1g27190 n=1 Tax=Impatiens glandulifera TaxID=253017 RepID=UPI001FB0E3E9|nr:probable inactive receptor kinase At1g27190 [Impatiens glandulifera]